VCDHNFQLVNCPLLGSLLAQKGLTFKGTYSLRDAAAMFDVSVRTIQDLVSSGALQARSLPGHARFLAEDLEDFLLNSIRKSPGDAGK
jgi:transposase